MDQPGCGLCVETRADCAVTWPGQGVCFVWKRPGLERSEYSQRSRRPAQRLANFAHPALESARKRAPQATSSGQDSTTRRWAVDRQRQISGAVAGLLRCRARFLGPMLRQALAGSWWPCRACCWPALAGKGVCSADSPLAGPARSAPGTKNPAHGRVWVVVLVSHWMKGFPWLSCPPVPTRSHPFPTRSRSLGREGVKSGI